MSWKDVGHWIQDNAGTGAVMAGALLTGNVPAAVAAGVALVTQATGEADPSKVLESLQNNPATVVKLRELAYQDEANIRHHIEEMTRLVLEDEQKSHATTQATIINSDNSQDRFVRWTRPMQSWLSLLFAGAYVFQSETIEMSILGLLLTLPLSYAGLRQVGKWGDAKHSAQMLSKL